MDNNLFGTIVTLVTDDKTEFICHKSFLTKSSEYFACLCSDKYNPSGDKIEIKDIPSNALHNILKFIYTGKYTFDLNELPDLLDGIEKFQLLEFKEIVDKSTCIETINIYDNTHLLDLFEMYNLTKALKFFRNVIMCDIIGYGYIGHLQENNLHIDFSNIDNIVNLFPSMKDYIQLSLIGCRLQPIKCEPYRHVLMYLTDADDYYTEDICLYDTISAEHDCTSIKVYSFSFNDKNYRLDYNEGNLCVTSDNIDTKLDSTIEVDNFTRFIKSNDKLYIISNNKIFIYQIEKMSELFKTIPTPREINSTGNIIVVDDKIYTVSFTIADSDITVSVHMNKETDLFKIISSKCTIDYCKNIKINNICELDGKIYISLVWTIPIYALSKTDNSGVLHDDDCPIDYGYTDLTRIIKCVKCKKYKSDCECKMIKEWDNYTYYNVDYSCEKCNDEAFDDDSYAKCYTNYYETLILGYDIKNDTINILSQLQGKNLRVASFEDKLYALNVVPPHYTLSVCDGDRWIPMLISDELNYLNKEITSFILFRDI